jgi:Na+/H+ antiporter NhaC
LIPTALPAAHAVGGGVLLLLAAAAVLDGSIFGDHCSPISDTTVMSSIGSSSDHLAHVVTQIPYAVVCMLVALGSYAWVALDGSRLWVHSLGVAVLVLILFVFGRKVSQHHPNAER